MQNPSQNPDRSSTGDARGGGRAHGVRLRGSVAGIDACELLSDRDDITIGSAPGVDLMVNDPLVPPKAIRIRREQPAPGDRKGASQRWLIEVLPGARAYVNNDLARREPLTPGDVISIGCHRFVFETIDALGRTKHSATEVADVCQRLLNAAPVPRGFLASLPSWRDRIRRRRAAVTGLIAAVLLLLPLLVPREQVFEEIQPPMEVVISDQRVMPSGSSVTALSSVQRKSVAMPEQDRSISDMMASAKPLPDLQPVPEEMKLDAKATPPPPPTLDKTTPDAGPRLAPLAVEPPKGEKLEFKHEADTIARSAPVRRLSVAEATRAETPTELAQPGVKIDSRQHQAAASTRYATELSQARSTAPAPDVPSTKTQSLAELAAFKPSPLKYDDYKGNRIPVAQVAQTLEALTPPAGSAGYVLDGKITEGEVAMSWKSGRFKKHAPGTPPDADPATFCYVGTIDADGKKWLYVGFLCTDPNPDAILAKCATNATNNPDASGIINDDSIEIFLDVNNDRRDYHQVIVNAHGYYWKAYYPTPTAMVESKFQGWPGEIRTKTTINKQAGNWVCEVMIPFDQLGGVPPKGSKWAVNFCRNFRGQKQDDHLSSWFLVYDTNRNYHHPELFGLFQW